MKQLDFTIVTPSFRQLEQLECCIASIADQEGISVEHIVQDGGTEGFRVYRKDGEDLAGSTGVSEGDGFRKG